jgi:hypothetical protein
MVPQGAGWADGPMARHRAGPLRQRACTSIASTTPARNRDCTDVGTRMGSSCPGRQCAMTSLWASLNAGTRMVSWPGASWQCSREISSSTLRRVGEADNRPWTRPGSRRCEAQKRDRQSSSPVEDHPGGGGTDGVRVLARHLRPGSWPCSTSGGPAAGQS